MRSKDEAFRILGEALEVAADGVDDAEVSLLGGRLGLVRFAENEVHQSMESDKESIAIRVVKDGRAGRVETTDLSREAIEAAVRQARMSAQFLPRPVDPASLPGPQTYRHVEAFDPSVDRATAVDRSVPVGRVLLEAARKRLVAAGAMEARVGPFDDTFEGHGVFAIANTRGVLSYHAGTRARFSLTLHNPGGATGWAETESHTLADVDGLSVFDVAARKAVPTLPISIVPGRYTVVLEPAAVASLISFIGSSAGGADAAAGSSFLSGRVGASVTNSAITISDDFTHPLHRGAPFDLEGVARRPVTLIERGVAKGAVYSRASAQRLGVEPTGHLTSSALADGTESAQHLVMLGGTGLTSELVKGISFGILVSRLWYTRLIDKRTLTLTGLTRDGTFLIENGELGAPVRSVRFNVEILDLLSRVEAMSASVRAGGSVVPGLRLGGFPITGGATA
ncbi:MAG: TldD/PmbA family protein [Deltaproteobacteria bacterium]|nr:TldD/PmbA family protein [Deltaproteobacteria bacterium]